MSAAEFLPTGPDCPSDYALDMLRADLLPGTEAIDIRAHIDTCEMCEVRLAMMVSGFDDEPNVDSRKLLAGARRLAAERDAAAQPWWKKLNIWLPVALGATAAIVFLVWPHAPGPQDGLPEPNMLHSTRLKGALGLRVYRAREGHAVEQISGGKFSAGDRLRFRVSLPHAGKVAIIGVEENGTMYRVWPLAPADGAMNKTTKTDGPEGRLLDGAFQLDSSTGEETLYLALCNDPPKCAVSSGRFGCQGGCIVTPFVLKKSP